MLSAAVIGCGRMGAFTRPEVAAAVPPGWLPLSHADAIDATPGLRLDALCDPDADALRRAGARHATARLFTDVGTMLRDARPQIVTIATRMPARREIFEAAAHGGVLGIHCEKPFARSIDEADLFADLLTRNVIAFSYGATRRYHAIYRRAAAMIAHGAIGELREIVVGFGAGRLLWTHAHSIDLFLFLGGCDDIDWVQAELATDMPPHGDEIDSDPLVRTAIIRLANGANGVICDLGGCDTLIAGSTGTIRIAADGASLEHATQSESGYFHLASHIKAEPGPSATQCALAELSVRASDRRRRSPELAAARMGTRILLAMVDSHRRGGLRVRLDDVPRTLTVTGRVGALTA